MENVILPISSGMYKAFVVTGEELWISSNKQSSMEKFEKSMEKTGIMASCFKIPLDQIQEIHFAEKDSGVKLKYMNDKGKQKSQTLAIGAEELANKFGNYLGEKIGLTRQTKTESRTKQLLVNGGILIIALAATGFLGFADMGDMSDTSTSGRNRGKQQMFIFLYELLGPNGILAIGGVISLYLAYTMYKRYMMPAEEVSYVRA